MDIHEYQAKQLLAKFGVNIPAGEIIYQPHEAVTVTSWLNEEEVMVNTRFTQVEGVNLEELKNVQVKKKLLKLLKK